VWIIAFVVALLGTLFALSGVNDVLRAEPETTPPPIAATSTAAKTTTDVSAASEPPDTLHFAVSSLKLPMDSPESRCVYALGRNSPAECKQIALAAIPTAEEPSLGRMRYLLARASANDPAGARAALETLAATSHPLAAMAHVRLSELLRDSDPQAALVSVETLLRDPRWKARLEPLRAVLLNRLGRTAEAEALLRDLVAQAPANTSASPASMTLAAILASRGDLASKKQALALYRRVFTRLPGTQTGEQARQQAQQLLNSMSQTERNASALTFSDLMTQADSMMGFRGYDRALREYRALEIRAKKNPDQACAARLAQGKALTSLRKTGEVVRVLSKVATDCTNEDIRAEAHYNLARAILRQGDALRAIGHYDAAVKLAPKSRLADDALYAAHHAYLELDDVDGARASLNTLLARDNSPADVRCNARFALAWLERRSGNLDSALEQLTQLMVEGPNETTEDLFGRAAYWHARTLLDKQDRAAASAEFVDLFRKRPLTYYAQQGLARLNEFDPKAAKQALDELRDTDPKVGIWMTVEPELKTSEFERAVELLRCGEPSRAQEELNALGVFDRKSSDQLYMLGTALLQTFGAQSQATITLARRRMGIIMRTQPKGDQRGLWRVAYPLAYSPMIDNIARNAGVPPAFVRAIAREESSFDCTAVSPANAYGLIQLISSTAKAYGRPMGLPHDPGSLKTPEINLRIGTSFMRDLFQRFAANPAVVPAAYNAGTGAAERWLRERPSMPLDEWIENIPYFETRRYTRRVLQTYGVYSWLDEGQLPVLRSRLPTQGTQATNDADAAITLR
jgi:soluble lytic murein transglycosylase